MTEKSFGTLQFTTYRLHLPRCSTSQHAEVVRTKRAVQFKDARALRAYREGDPRVVASVDLGGARTFFVVPMLKDGLLICTISNDRQEVRPFPTKEIELVANFANQAVNCHRECAAHERAARIAAAADRDRRRAQGYQPLHLRPPNRARHIGPVGGTTV